MPKWMDYRDPGRFAQRLLLAPVAWLVPNEHWGALAKRVVTFRSRLSKRGANKRFAIRRACEGAHTNADPREIAEAVAVRRLIEQLQVLREPGPPF